MLAGMFSRGRSMRQQLIVGVALVHAVLMTIFIVDLVARQRAFLHDEQVQRSTGLVQGIARQVTVGVLAGDLGAVQEVVDGLKDYPELKYALVTDASGKVLAHSDRRHTGEYLSDAPSRTLLAGPRRLSTLADDDRSIDLAMPVQSGGRLIGWARLGVGGQATEASLRGVAAKGALYALTAIAIGAALAYWMAEAITRRLYELLRVADQTRAGQRDLRAPTDTVNEVGRLAGAFNAMLDALTDRERELQQANAALETRVAQRTAELAESEATQRAILEHANDAFIQMDAQGLVVGWNRMAETTFGWPREEALGRRLAELIIPAAQHEAHERGLQRFLATGEGRVIDRRVEMVGCTRERREIAIELSLRVRRRGEACFFDAFLRDITERKRLEESLELQASTDALTGLPNRRSLLDALPMAMHRADRSRRPLALLFLDLDGFKGVNDRHGHEAGDRVLAEFARRLRGAVREVDTVARLAGDEFVVIAESLTPHSRDAHTVAAKIIDASLVPFELGDAAARLSASVGVALYVPGDTGSADGLLSQADEAMYESKRLGKGRFTVWRDASLPVA